MFTLYGGNGKRWAEITPQEQKIALIVMGIILLIIIAYGIYFFFKNRKDN